MNVGAPVRVYDEIDEWFSEGEVIAVDDAGIEVDFYDWVQRYDPSELTPKIIFYTEVLVAKSTAGQTISDFR